MFHLDLKVGALQEEIRMLDDIPNDTLASLENCTLDEIISILQNHACDPTI
jgi:hypothetical protein